jgi:membrane-bound metal-dependent hydrolase YbcI (DUF457 family)
MDALTHLAVAGAAGLALGRSRWKPQRAGWLILAAAALAPDAEQALRSFDTALYLRLYHGPLHSLAAAGVIIAALWWLGRKRAVPAAAILAAAGAGSHLFLDLFSGYGAALFWPLSPRRWHWPLLANYDLATLVILGLTLAGPAVLNAVNREIGATRVNHARAAWVALALLAAMLPVRAVLRARISAAAHASPLAAEADSVSVFPVQVLPWLWLAVEDTPIAYLVYEVNAITGQRTPFIVRLAKPLPNNYLNTARETPTGKAFLDMATYPLYSLEEGSRAPRVRIRDLAFYTPGGSDRPFSVEIEVTSTQKVLAERAVF